MPYLGKLKAMVTITERSTCENQDLIGSKDKTNNEQERKLP